jgi:predicted phosphoribosyltransferase
MGRILADALGGELDVVLVRKLGAPNQPELAIGAVDEHGEVYLTEAASFLRVSEVYLRDECRRQFSLLRARRRRYTPDRPPISPSGRVVIVLDDGVATGATMIAALRAVRDQHPEELIAAAAVMPPETYTRIAAEADRVVCLQTPAEFGSVGRFFEDFTQVSDEQVAAVLGPEAACAAASNNASATPASGSIH